jgi:tetratricopeptide (TPR) repeat protein
MSGCNNLEDFDFLKKEEVINFWREELLEGKKYYEEFLDHFLNQLRFPFYRFREINKSRIDELYKLACDFFEEGDYRSAKTYFSLGISYDHNNVLFWKGKAEVSIKLNTYEEAINAYDRAYEISQEASTLLRLEAAKLALREQEKTI